LSDPLASDAVKPWRRLAASAIDIVLLLPAHSALLLFLPEHQAVMALIVIALLAAVICWRLFGATPGLALMDATLITSNTQRRPAFAQLLKRLLGIVLATLPLGIGLLWIFKGPAHQGWQDIFSGTAIIIDDEARKSLQQLEEEAQ
jgi:uncharacterized RDD family membrane protein YckC